jgi:hypothetical protein
VSGKKIALAAIPVVVATIALAAVFAFPSSQSTPEDDSDDNPPVVPASAEDCSAISPRVGSVIANGIGQATDETDAAANTLVEQYCQRPDMISEISAMANPALGLVAYGCDVGTGKIVEPAVQGSISAYTQVYCDGSLVGILENSEFLRVSIADYREQILNQNDSGEDPDAGNGNDINVEQAEAKLQEASDLADKTQSQASAGQHYEAAKSLDNAIKLVDSIGQK